MFSSVNLLDCHLLYPVSSLSFYSRKTCEKEFEIPLTIPASAFDPFDRTMKDI